MMENKNEELQELIDFLNSEDATEVGIALKDIAGHPTGEAEILELVEDLLEDTRFYRIRVQYPYIALRLLAGFAYAAETQQAVCVRNTPHAIGKKDSHLWELAEEVFTTARVPFEEISSEYCKAFERLLIAGKLPIYDLKIEPSRELKKYLIGIEWFGKAAPDALPRCR